MYGKEKMKKGLYFVHEYYSESCDDEFYSKDLDKEHMLLMRDNINDMYDAQMFDVNPREVHMRSEVHEGEYVYFDGERIFPATDDATALIYAEMNKQISDEITLNNAKIEPEELQGYITDVKSYHINVGHGNCSVIVFREDEEYCVWMVDCSVYDATSKKSYVSNFDSCMQDIGKRYGVTRVAKLMITHLHYDHINGIEHCINKGWIDKDTEVWMNNQYPWKLASYQRVLFIMKSIGIKFVDPVRCNSTEQINVLYPTVSFSRIYQVQNINNASVVYQICLGRKKMLFTGDIETDDLENVAESLADMRDSSYYCISSHGCISSNIVNNKTKGMAQCAAGSEVQILMGRNGVYRGKMKKALLEEYNNVAKTQAAKKYFILNWSTNEISMH